MGLFFWLVVFLKHKIMAKWDYFYVIHNLFLRILEKGYGMSLFSCTKIKFKEYIKKKKKKSLHQFTPFLLNLEGL